MLAQIDPEFLFADGFDDCIIGFTVENDVPVVLYSTSKVIKKLEEEMSHSDACDYFYFNIKGAYVGVRTPVFLEDEDDT
jgi:hypothetical protein